MSIYVPDRLPKHWPLNFYPGMFAFRAVSYTHLDVYKRQHLEGKKALIYAAFQTR